MHFETIQLSNLFLCSFWKRGLLRKEMILALAAATIVFFFIICLIKIEKAIFAVLLFFNVVVIFGWCFAALISDRIIFSY